MADSDPNADGPEWHFPTSKLSYLGLVKLAACSTWLRSCQSMCWHQRAYWFGLFTCRSSFASRSAIDQPLIPRLDGKNPDRVSDYRNDAMTDFSQTVRRAIHLLTLIHADDGKLDFTSIQKASGMGRTVCHRLLGTLQHEGMVIRSPDTGRYAIGPKVIELAGSALGHNALRVQANPVLRELARKTGDAVLLFIPYGAYAMCVDRMDGDAPVRAAGVDIGGKLPLHTGGAPFAILSYLSAQEQEAIIQGALDTPTEKTITAPNELRLKIESTRRKGYAIGDEDAIDQVVAIGAPIFGPGGRLFGAVSVGGAKTRYKAARMRSTVSIVIGAADSISRAIGGSRPGKEGAS